jgi:hypothetical protein
MSLAIPGKWSRANVFFSAPLAPLAPAITMQRGFRLVLVVSQVYQFKDELRALLAKSRKYLRDRFGNI